MNITNRATSNSVFQHGAEPADSQGMTKKSKGRWVFVPLAKWETKPPCFYSIRVSAIYLRLFNKVPDEDLNFCMRQQILPPEKMRAARLLVWIAGARAGYAAPGCVCDPFRRYGAV